MTDASRPAPLVPADVDLRDFGFMPLDVLRLRDSDLMALATGDEFKAAVALWCVAWHQVPAASLPNDDRLLARYSGAGPAWRKVKAEALRGFVECSDGRLYHSTISEKALEAWGAKAAQRARTKAATEAREAKRRAEQAQRDVQRNEQRDEQRDVQRNVVQGTGTGTGTGIEEKENPPPPSGVPPPEPRAKALPCPEGVDAQVWTDWLSLRKAKKAPVTDTVLRSATTEAGKAGMTLEAFLRVWCARGSQGLQADWLKPEERRGGTAVQRQLETAALMTGAVRPIRPALPAQETLDVESRVIAS